ncbi:hypothetical protein SDC9_189220 [bioreactor metagenome]|uniref:Uncharacterized protein n=1 Tax=bioreactor metagenome TaxID=1076179 RepID=A0A645HSV9_9ZZZZ
MPAAPSINALASFSTGTASPVNEASSIFKFELSISLKSAGIISPASNTTTSPGTIFDAVISDCLPFLITFAFGALIFCNASTDFSALPS